ncbi:hypothetical protein F3J34_49310 [Klebsiella sp. Ap-873]|nr:hypothetical protein [Klebsiella sp. Ap-873]
MELTKRELTMLTTFLARTRYWKGMPAAAESLWDKGMIKPTKFGMGNFQITEKGLAYLKQPEIKATGH